MLHRCMPGENSITRGFGEKILAQTKSPIPPTPPPPSPSLKFKWYSVIRFRLHVAQNEDKRKQGNEPKLAICNI